MSCEAMTLQAAKLSEHTTVQYCNFTLRPLSYDVFKQEGGMFVWQSRNENFIFVGMNIIC